MAVKKQQVEKISISLETFIENFKDQIPDFVEHKILYSLYEIAGFQREYDQSIFLVSKNASNQHKLSLANLINQIKNKLDLVESIEKYSSLLLTHPNVEARKVPLLVSDGATFGAESFTSSVEQIKKTLKQTLTLIERRNKFELDKLIKRDYNKSCFEVVDFKKIKIVEGTKISFTDSLTGEDASVEFTRDKLVSLPRLKKGADYQIIVHKNGKIQALNSEELISDSDETFLIGGFHYAPGGNADDSRKGGDDKPQINPFSVWDVAWRPAACDPRGMTLIDGEFWCDIYPMTEDGKNTYGKKIRTNIDWWETNEHIADQGKRCPSEEQFQKLAFGTTENQSSGTRIEKASLAEKFTSKWGVMMSTGCYYVWGNPFTIPEPSEED